MQRRLYLLFYCSFSSCDHTQNFPVSESLYCPLPSVVVYKIDGGKVLKYSNFLLTIFKGNIWYNSCFFFADRPDTFQLSLSLAYSELTVTCAATGGHPTPELHLYLRGDLQNVTAGHSALAATPRDGRPGIVASLRTVFRLAQLGDSERISCVLRLPRTNFSLGRTELFHKYPTKYPARFLSLPYTSRAAVGGGSVKNFHRLDAWMPILFIVFYSWRKSLWWWKKRLINYQLLISNPDSKKCKLLLRLRCLDASMYI
jgi:hypothetical protein